MNRSYKLGFVVKSPITVKDYFLFHYFLYISISSGNLQVGELAGSGQNSNILASLYKTPPSCNTLMAFGSNSSSNSNFLGFFEHGLRDVFLPLLLS